MYKKYTLLIDKYAKNVYNRIINKGGECVEAKRFD